MKFHENQRKSKEIDTSGNGNPPKNVENPSKIFKILGISSGFLEILGISSGFLENLENPDNSLEISKIPTISSKISPAGLQISPAGLQTSNLVNLKIEMDSNSGKSQNKK